MQQLMDLGVEAEVVAETVHTTPDNVRAWADLIKLPRKVRALYVTWNGVDFRPLLGDNRLLRGRGALLTR